MTVHKIVLKAAAHATAHMLLDRGDERLSLGVSKEPLFTAARILLDYGIAKPDDKIITQWDGSEHWSMRAKVGFAATRTVCERASGGILIQKFNPGNAALSDATKEAACHA